MKTVDTSYLGAVALVIVAILKGFGIEIANDVVTGIVTGVVALWIAFKQKTEKNLTIGGLRK